MHRIVAGSAPRLQLRSLAPPRFSDLKHETGSPFRYLGLRKRS